MLNEQEKREMLEDAHSRNRRESFKKAKLLDSDGMNMKFTLDGYLNFLTNINKIFSFKEKPFRKPVTRLNRI